MTVYHSSAEYLRDAQAFEDYILKECNIMKLLVVPDDEECIKWKVQPNLKALGQRFGRNLASVRRAISMITQEQIKSFLRSGSIRLEQSISLTKGELLISLDTENAVHKNGEALATDNDVVVGVDTRVTSANMKTAYFRQLVNEIQKSRKRDEYSPLDDLQACIVPLSCDGRGFFKDLVTNQAPLTDAVQKTAIVMAPISEVFDVQRSFQVGQYQASIKFRKVT